MTQNNESQCREEFEKECLKMGWNHKKLDNGYADIRVYEQWIIWKSAYQAGVASASAWQPIETAPKDGTDEAKHGK